MTGTGTLLAVAAAVCCVSGCGNSVDVSAGANEPLTVSNGQFLPGSLPADQGGPAITSLTGFASTIVPAGTVNKGIGGSAGPGSFSVAVALDGLSHGYWVAPVTVPDQEVPGELLWKVVCNFAHDLPAGPQTLRFAAGNRDGRFGPVRTLGIMALPFRPTGHVVASLTWGNDADLDLHLVGPSGKELDPKHPTTTEIIDAGPDQGKPLPGGGTLDHDSNANCVSDGYRSENVVWKDDMNAPESGTYTVRVDMFSACGLPATTFVFDLYIDGVQVVEQHHAGRLLDIDADNGGPGSGLYVTQFTL